MSFCVPNDFNVRFFTAEQPLDVHQAAHINPHHGIGAAGDDVFDFIFHHGRRNFRIFDGKGSTETAALIRILHFDELGAAGQHPRG